MKRSRYASISEINVTNLVDVTLVLLIIFMITAPLLRTGIDVNLPKARADEIQTHEGLVITLTQEGVLFIHDEKVEKNDFERILRLRYQASGQRPVLLKADKEIPYGRVIQLMDKIKSADITNLGLIVEPGEEE